MREAHLPVGDGSHRGGEGTRRPTRRDVLKKAAKGLAALPIVTFEKGGKGTRRPTHCDVLKKAAKGLAALPL